MVGFFFESGSIKRQFDPKKGKKRFRNVVECKLRCHGSLFFYVSFFHTLTHHVPCQTIRLHRRSRISRPCWSGSTLFNNRHHGFKFSLPQATVSQASSVRRNLFAPLERRGSVFVRSNRNDSLKSKETEDVRRQRPRTARSRPTG